MWKSLFELSDQFQTLTFLNDAVVYTQNTNGSPEEEYKAA